MNASRRLLICFILLCVPLLLIGPVGRFAVIVPLVFFVPGYLLERSLRFSVPIPWFVRPALWLAGSISIIPIIYAWCWLIGFHLSLLMIIIPLFGASLLAGWLIWQNSQSSLTRDTSVWASVGSGLLVFMLTFARRLYEIRNDALPLWVDSVHHAVLVRVVAEQGTIPIDVRPYIPVSELPYHWGFHVVVGTILRITALDLPQTMLWSGQIINALQILTVGALAAYFWRSSVAGIVAAIVVGLVSLMPAYLVTWGRYTLLEGLLILPPLVIATLAGMRGAGWRAWLFAAILTGGLLVTHYIASVFALTLLSLLFMWHIAADNIRSQDLSMVRHVVKTAWTFGLTMIGGALFAAPWLLVLSSRIFVRYAQNPNELRGGGSYNAFSEGLLWAGQNRVLFGFAALALLLSLWRRRNAGIYLVVWPFLLLFLANPSIAGLPTLWLVTNTEVLVSLYIPVAALVGGGAALVWSMADSPHDNILSLSDSASSTTRSLRINSSQIILLGALILAAWAGERSLGDVINPTTRIASAADITAIDWIAANTPPDARFLTAATSWLPDAERGADGGWWVVPLAGRWSSTPPVLFTYAAPAEVAEIQQRTRALANLQAGQEASTLTDIIEQNDINYIYVGDKPTSFKAEWFENNPRYERVYDHDGIRIFACRP